MQKLLQERQAFTRGTTAPSAAATVPSAPSVSTRTGMSLPSLKGVIPSIGVPGGSSIIQILFYISLFLFILFLILTFIHFTIRPIFKLSPTDNAILGSLATEDMQSEWIKESSADKIANFKPPKSCDITLSMDVYSTGDYTSVTAPKVFLYRSEAAGAIAANAKVSDLLTVLPTTNLIAYFENETDNLIVSAVTTMNNTKRLESCAPITNLPVKSPFRLTIVLMSNFFEVYIDGKLRSTVTLKGVLLTSVQPFWPQTARFDKVVRVGKLHYWPRAIAAVEIRNLEPVVSNNFFIQKT